MEALEKTERRQGSGRLEPWRMTPIDFGLMLCIFLCCMYFFSSIAALAYDWTFGGEDSEDSLLPAIITGFGLQLGGICGYLLFKGIAPAQRKSLSSSNFAAVGYGLLGLLGAYALLIIVAPLWKLALTYTGLSTDYQQPVIMLLEAGSSIEKATLGILIVIVAPVAEEIVFRGALFRYLHGKLPGFMAIGATSLIFASMHLNLLSLAPLFALSCVLCLVYRKTGNLLSCISAHIAFNLVNFIAITTMPELVQ